MRDRDPYEPPDVRRAKRLAEAKANRHSPERLAMVAELERKKAAAAEVERIEAARESGRRTRAPGSSTPRAQRAPKAAASPPEPKIFGHPVAEWVELRTAVERRLGEIARERRTTDAAELWADLGASTSIELGDPRFKVPRLLTDVAALSAGASGVLPSALVVESAKTGPGRRFFAHALELGLLGDLFLPPGEEFHLTDGLRTWWEGQIEQVYDRYATEPGLDPEG